MKRVGNILAILGIWTLYLAAPLPAAADAPKGGTAMHAMHGHMEGMAQHMEEMKKAVADLRESEKKLESTADPQAFRASVIEHLKKIDDLHASHLEHMESMMGRMQKGQGGMMHGKPSGGGGCGCPCGCCGGCTGECR